MDENVNVNYEQPQPDVIIQHNPPNQTHSQQVEYQQQMPSQQVIVQQQPQQIYVTGISPAWPVKSKIVAGLLAIFLGGLGIHKFYLGKIGQGIVYLLFCWTLIPEVIGFIEGIVYLCSNDENFQLKHHVRLE